MELLLNPNFIQSKNSILSVKNTKKRTKSTDFASFFKISQRPSETEWILWFYL